MLYVPQTPQEIFNIAYVRSKRDDMQTLWNGTYMDPTFENVGNNPQTPPLSQSARNALIGSLQSQGVLIDEQIDYWGWDPYTTMVTRVGAGLNWVYPLGTGPSNPIAGNQAGPPPFGTIKVSTNPADFPPYNKTNPPSPVVFSVNPIGVLEVAYGQPNGIGDLYAQSPNWISTSTTWVDSRGTFTKIFLIELMGTISVWKKTA